MSKLIDDLKGLLDIVDDGKEGYLSASEVVSSLELKELFLRMASQRIGYANELKSLIALHGGSNENESGGILGLLHKTWVDFKHALSNKEDEAILATVESGEQAALDKYDAVLEDEETHAQHVNLLQKQRTGILEALKEVESYRISLER